MAKKKLDITTAAEKKKRGPNATSFSKEHPSPAQFEPGQSGNPGGKAREHLALARALRAGGAGRAPDEECTAVGLPLGSSKIQVAAERILRSMRRGSYPEHLQAAELYARLTGEFTSKVALGFDMGDDEGDTPTLQIVFESSPDALQNQHAVGSVIERRLPPPGPSPELQAPREEQQRASAVESLAATEPQSEPETEPAAPAAPEPQSAPAKKQVALGTGRPSVWLGPHWRG